MIDKNKTTIDGVLILDLLTHPDERGQLTEIFRKEWDLGPDPLQWNVVNSYKGVLRGVHVHFKHTDYLVVIKGRFFLGLKDLRKESPSFNKTFTTETTGDKLQILVIPPGVAHGFMSMEDSTYIYAVTHYWDKNDELGCHWQDKNLGIKWPKKEAITSDKDTNLPPLKELYDLVPSWQDPSKK